VWWNNRLSFLVVLCDGYKEIEEGVPGTTTPPMKWLSWIPFPQQKLQWHKEQEAVVLSWKGRGVVVE